MSETIPADILERALKLSSWTFGTTDDKDVMEVAAALLAERLAERERAAKVAEASRGFHGGHPYYRQAQLEIASAIRSQP